MAERSNTEGNALVARAGGRGKSGSRRRHRPKDHGSRDGGEPPPASTSPVPVAQLLDLVQRDLQGAAVLHWLSGVVVDVFTDQGGPPPRWVLRRGNSGGTEVVRPDVVMDLAGRLEALADEARARVEALLRAEVPGVKLPAVDPEEQHVEQAPTVVRNEHRNERGRRQHVQPEGDDEL